MDIGKPVGLLYLDPGLPKEEPLRTVISNGVKANLEALHPMILSRLQELGPMATDELGPYADFMLEARTAFLYGLWRSTIALTGVAADSFVDEIYEQVKAITGPTGTKLDTSAVLGKSPPQKTKIQILRLQDLITAGGVDKLLKIKKLRDRYVHADTAGSDIGHDAREAMTLFTSVLIERYVMKAAG